MSCLIPILQVGCHVNDMECDVLCSAAMCRELKWNPLEHSNG